MARRTQTALARRVAAIVVLAAALGYIEAGVVVYLRRTIIPLRKELFPDRAAEPLPLTTYQQLADAGQEFVGLLKTELVREVAAVTVLAAAAAGMRRRRGELAGLFVLGFAVWDILYYVFLKVLIDWPATLSAWDVLFLIPRPWVAPVWAPLAVSATLLIAAPFIFARAGHGRARGMFGAAAAMLAGTGLVLASFFMRTGQAYQAVPEAFDWPWFAAGWLLGVVGIVLWLGRRVVREL